VLAIFDRAETRDFTDLDALSRVYPLSELVELAERTDTGFDRPRFVEALASFRRFTPADLRVGPDDHRRLARVVEGWRRQIERTLERDIDFGHHSPGL
jgi:hypothetical protein